VLVLVLSEAEPSGPRTRIPGWVENENENEDEDEGDLTTILASPWLGVARRAKPAAFSLVPAAGPAV
jgi:hypothetical protein